ncbi:hypothetical protein ACFQ23_13305 [Schaalia naturae]|uniref:Uncharacterized protein n=1 Tax=Schaalia naturae TaxID=635203 RepID=A0ABW2SPV1_9ACTO
MRHPSLPAQAQAPDGPPAPGPSSGRAARRPGDAGTPEAAPVRSAATSPGAGMDRSSAAPLFRDRTLFLARGD